MIIYTIILFYDRIYVNKKIIKLTVLYMHPCLYKLKNELEGDTMNS